MKDFEKIAFKDLRVWDCHMHLGVPLKKLLQIMTEYHIEKAVVIPLDFNGYGLDEIYHESLKPEKSKKYVSKVLRNLSEVNQRFLKNVSGYDQIIPAPWISPETKNVEDIIYDESIKVIKFIPSLDNMVTDINQLFSDLLTQEEIEFNEVYQVISELITNEYVNNISSIIKEVIDQGKKPMIHTGWHALPIIVGKLADKYKNGSFIMAHAKEDDDFYKFARLKVLKENHNVWLETSHYSSVKRLKDYVNEGLEDQLLFGSDYITKGYEENISHQVIGVKLATSKDLEQKILYKNAEKLFRNH